MRQCVRAWINVWDLVRLDPDYQPTTDAVDTPTDYRETPELDGDNADDTGSRPEGDSDAGT